MGQGWYCSCRYRTEEQMTEDGKITQNIEMSREEKESCNYFKRIFTHNKCINQLRIIEDGKAENIFRFFSNIF